MGGERKPSGDGEKGIGIGGFDLEAVVVVVVKKAPEQYVDHQTTDYLHPHAVTSSR